MQAKDNLDATPLNLAEDQVSRIANFTSRLDASARYVLLLPTIVIVLVLSVFPLLVSLYLSFSVFKIVRGGFEIDFVGLANYAKLITGSQQRSFLGRQGQIPFLGWVVLAVFAGFLIYMLYSYFRSPRFSIFGAIMRLITVVLSAALAWLIMVTLIANDGLPGSLVVTLVFVVGGVIIEYLFGLGLALLLVQNLPGKRFFRVIFLLPMMITPVGIGFLFKMMTDGLKGPFSPLLLALGLGNYFDAGAGRHRSYRRVDWRHLGVDAVHVHYFAGGGRRGLQRNHRSGSGRRCEPRFSCSAASSFPN